MKRTARDSSLVLAALALSSTACGRIGYGVRDAGIEDVTARDGSADVAADAADVSLFDAVDAPPADTLDAADVAPADALADARDADAAPMDSSPDVSLDASGDAPGDTLLADVASEPSPFSSGCESYAHVFTAADETFTGRATGPSRESGNRCEPTSTGPEAYFSFVNPGASRWFFDTEDPRTSALTTLSLRAACADPASEYACCYERDNPGTHSSFSAAFEAPGTYTVVLDRRDGEGPFDYAMRVRRVPFAANATCGAPGVPALAPDGALLAGQDLEGTYAGDTGACFRQPAASQLFYRITLAPMTQVTVTVTPTEAPRYPAVWYPRLRITGACDAQCLGYATLRGVGGLPVSAVAVNNTAAPRSVIASVANADSQHFGVFSIATRAEPIAPGLSCDAPEQLRLGDTVRGRNALTESGPQAPICQSPALGEPDANSHRHFAVTVPAGRRARLTVTPTGTPWSPLVRRYHGCPVDACEGSLGPLAPGAPVVTDLENTGTADRVFSFTVAQRDPDPFTYDVGTELLPGTIAYVASAIPARCDALAPTDVLHTGASVDEGVSGTLALPFSFALFGQPVTHYAVSSNGFMQLFSSSSSRGTAAPLSRSLPDPMAPSGLVAPYWADLAPRAGEVEVRSGVVDDAAGRRFVTHWRGFSLERDPSTTLSFQVKLFEASRAVEFHWCALTDASPRARVRGSAATVGMQDLAGADGVTFARNAQDALDVATALRYVPRP